MTFVVGGAVIVTISIVKMVRRPGIKQRKSAQLSEFAKAKDWRYAEDDESLGGPWGGSSGGDRVLTGGYRGRQITAYHGPQVEPWRARRAGHGRTT